MASERPFWFSGRLHEVQGGPISQKVSEYPKVTLRNPKGASPHLPDITGKFFQSHPGGRVRTFRCGSRTHVKSGGPEPADKEDQPVYNTCKCMQKT